MAVLIPPYTSCARRMTSGERRFAQRLESLLEPECLCWYDVPVGTKYQHPDFVLLDCHGLLVLEVKDWKRDTIQKINPVSASLLTPTGLKEVGNPLLQARQNAFAVKNLLERDLQLRAPESDVHGGKLVCPYGFGVVLSEITRKEFNGTDLGEVLPPHLVVCKDEMSEGVKAESFQERLRGMFNVQFAHELTMPQVDRIRWHMFPELRISQGSLFESDDTFGEDAGADNLLRVMDLQQELLARGLGDGHRVIHGVAGSGKTLILGFRCEQLAKSTDKPILVLCYNVALAAKLEQLMMTRGLGERVVVRNFHRWCSDQLTLYHIEKPRQGPEFFSGLVAAVISAVESGHIPRAQYGAVLIDEGHDFHAEWFKLVTQMVDPATNSLLLLYDDAQSIYGKKRSSGFSFKSVGVQAQGRTTILRMNYRNTDEILDCAYEFAKDTLTPAEAEEDGVPLVKPEMAGRHGPAPHVERLNSLASESLYIAERLTALHEQGSPWNHMAVLYSKQSIAPTLTRELKSRNIPYEWLKTSQTKRFDSTHDSVKVMTIHSSKGLEFPIVAIAGIGFMPTEIDKSEDEARLLYVGMTRATEHLFMTASRDSPFVRRFADLEAAA
jgi:UvrD-like helicase C-terminal domain/Nuclease-related domain/AAA domain